MKTRLLLTVVFFLSLAAPAIAQDRQRQPTIQEQIAELRQMIEELTQRIAALEARTQAGEAPANADQAAEIEREFKAGKLAIGMTLKQVQQLAGSRGQLQTTAGNAQVYMFTVPRDKHLIRDSRVSPGLSPYLLHARFHSGKLAAFEMDDREIRGGAVR